MTNELNGADYIATVRLSDRENNTLAVPGETCWRVPQESLGWLAEQALIVPAPPEGQSEAEA